MLFLVFHFNSFASFCQLAGFHQRRPLKLRHTTGISTELGWVWFGEGPHHLLISFFSLLFKLPTCTQGVDTVGDRGAWSPLFFQTRGSRSQWLWRPSWRWLLPKLDRV